MGGPVDAICHRHCALAIHPEQYLVVHENLMEAVGEVLGDAVTPPVGAAWSEAVCFLAKACIDKEEALYKMAEAREGGWSGFLKFEVSEITEVAPDVKSFSFKPPAGTALAGKNFEFTPGQYLSLKLDPEGNGLMAPRHYTVTSPPGADFLQCTIKKLPGGKGSTYAHENLSVGSTVELTAPYGVYTVENEALTESSVLMSAGIGVTPMLNFSRALGDNVKLAVHVDKSKDSFAYRSALAGHPMLEKYTDSGGRPSAASLVQETLAQAGKDNNFYICGPPKWMEEVSAELTQQGAKQVKTEVFGSQLATGCPFAVRAA